MVTIVLALREDHMVDAYGKVRESRSGLEKLLEIIPGWSGYQERQNRRKADQVLRQTLAEKLAAQRRSLMWRRVSLSPTARSNLWTMWAAR
jgi:hypothetical protein